MKKIFLIAFLCNISLLAFCQSINISLNATGTQPYNASSSFIVNANCSYSGISNGTTVTFKFSYDNTKISFANCNTSAFVFTPSLNGNITTQTTTFVAQAGNNQFLSLPLCFNFVCPSVCMGQNISTIINSNISTGQLNAASPPLSIAGMVQNTWGGTNNWHSFLLTSYTVTFKAVINYGACSKITNPKFIVTPNIGTLLSASNATVSGNTITPNTTVLPDPSQSSNFFVQFYTIQLPCNTPANTVVGCDFQVQGTNCGLSNQVITNLPAASFTLPTNTSPAPNSTLSGSLMVDAWGNNYMQTTLTNTGNTTLNLTQTIDIPNVKTIKLFHNTNSTANSIVSLQWIDCNNTTSASVSFPIGTNNVTPPTYAKKAKLTINGLPPSEKNVFSLFFDFTNSCNGVPNSTSYTFNTNAVYNCVSLPNSCNPCGQGNGQATSPPIIYNTKPLIQCTKTSEFQNICFKTDDIIDLFIRFKNVGTAPLINGVLTYPLPAGLTYVPNSVVYLGFSTNPTLINNTNVNWNLPASLPVSPTGTEYEIKFKVKVNSSAAFGSYLFFSNLNAPGYIPHSSWCGQKIDICQITLANVVKEVKGDLDNSFSQNGNATANGTALYKVTVFNTGTTVLDNVVLVDRLPFTGDKRITDCQPRNSAFTIQSPNALTSILGISSIEYSSMQNVATGWANTTTTCNIPSQLNTFSSGFSANNIKFKLANPILPGSSFSFQFPAKVSASATNGSKACNSIAFVADFTNTGGVKQGDVTAIESNNACLQISQVTNPCGNPCDYGGSVSINGISTNITNGIRLSIECNQTFDGSIKKECNGISSLLNNYVVKKLPSNNIIATLSNGLTHSFTSVGNYSVTYYNINANGVKCDSLIVYFNVTCTPCGDWVYKGVFVQGDADPGGAFNIPCGTTKNTTIGKIIYTAAARYCDMPVNNQPPNQISVIRSIITNPANQIVSNKILTEYDGMDSIKTDTCGRYKIQLISKCGNRICDTCTYFVDVACVINPPPCRFTANAGPDKTICLGASTTIGTTVLIPTGEVYAWASNPVSTITNAIMPTVSPSVTTTYYLTVTKQGCPTKKDTVIVTVNNCPPPTCTPCTTKLASPIRDTLVPYQGMSSLLEAFTFTNLPANIIEVRSTVTNFTLTSVDANGKVNDECTQCNTNATTWASVWGGDKIDGIKPKVNLNGVETLGNITLPQMTPNKNPRHAVWSNNGAILNVPNTIKVGFFLPAKSTLSCCTVKANICVKFVFRNDKCEECVVSRCFDVVIDK